MKNIQMYIDSDVLLNIEKLISKDQSVENGGLLLGNIEYIGNMINITISGAINACYEESFIDEIQYSPFLWKFMYQEAKNKFPLLKVIGWFHADRDIRMELSQFDLNLHYRFFNKENHIVMIYDPMSKRKAIFNNCKGKMLPCSNIYILDKKDELLNPNLTVEKKKTVENKRHLVNSINIKKAVVFISVLIICLISVMYRDITKPISNEHFAYKKLNNNSTLTEQNNPTINNQSEKDLKVSTPISEENKKNVRSEIVESTIELYTVKPGDSLWEISNRYYGSGFEFYKIMQQNKIINPNNINVGSVLEIKIDKK